MTGALIFIISNVATLYIYIIVASVVLSWLIAFNIINPHNQVVRTIQMFCYRVTEPLLRPIRNMLPDLGGLDISPIILLLAVGAVEILLVNLLQGKFL